jgi:hypothetical protein
VGDLAVTSSASSMGELVRQPGPGVSSAPGETAPRQLARRPLPDVAERPPPAPSRPPSRGLGRSSPQARSTRSVVTHPARPQRSSANPSAIEGLGGFDGIKPGGDSDGGSDLDSRPWRNNRKPEPLCGRSTPRRSSDFGSNRTIARSAEATRGTREISCRPRSWTCHCCSLWPLRSRSNSQRRRTSTYLSPASYVGIRCSSTQAFSTYGIRRRLRRSLQYAVLRLIRNEHPTGHSELRPVGDTGHNGPGNPWGGGRDCG